MEQNQEFRRLMQAEDGGLTAMQRVFRETHNEIVYNGNLAAELVGRMARKLKEMKDGELYRAAGFLSFEEYTELAVGIKARQAYNYIKIYDELSEQFLQSNAKIGVTKLALLASASFTDREELVAENDVESLTVKELKAKLAEKERAVSQLTLDLCAVSEELVTRDRDCQKLKDEARLSTNAPL